VFYGDLDVNMDDGLEGRLRLRLRCGWIYDLVHKGRLVAVV
jgi:hypothetical protein